MACYHSNIFLMNVYDIYWEDALDSKVKQNAEEVVLPMQGENKVLPCFCHFLKYLPPCLFVFTFSWNSQADNEAFSESQFTTHKELIPISGQWNVFGTTALKALWEVSIVFLGLRYEIAWFNGDLKSGHQLQEFILFSLQILSLVVISRMANFYMDQITESCPVMVNQGLLYSDCVCVCVCVPVYT